ncbi:structural protein P5 [Vibrio cholerae]|nr:structural protein P5 [Vibrio cholerae]EHZ6902515.1 structural protein P5 [Vibrio cholerae]EJK2104161.1 structural protein P5 [Vibrio cholerae]EJL6646449.1 structural protein P5 [Vibrio cholerae]
MSVIRNAVLIGGVCALFYFGAREMMPRGIRNNNPLNIEYNKSNDWEGQTGVEPEGRFARFNAAKYGIRAGAKLISNYMTIHNKQSVIAILERFAPSNENHTANYANFVANKLGVGVSERLTTKHIPAMVKAMIQFENGLNPYTDDYINQGCQMAGVI